MERKEAKCWTPHEERGHVIYPALAAEELMPMFKSGAPPDGQCLDNFDRLWVRRDRCVLGSEHLCGTQHHHWEMHSMS